MKSNRKKEIYPSASDDARTAESCMPTPQTLSPSYRLAYRDTDFLLKDELRPVRLQLELLKPELILQENNIKSTVIMFGSARLLDPKAAGEKLAAAKAKASEDPSNEVLARNVKTMSRIAANSKYYEEARRLSFLISQEMNRSDNNDLVVITGGGPGIMEAANRGAFDAGAKSIGFNIVIPSEQKPNEYITPALSFQFHYFAIRKMHFLMRARALVAFPGGYGTLDEFFEALTLIQTKKIKRIPVLIFGQEFWDRIINFEAMLEEGVISYEDLDLFRYVETAEEACEFIIKSFRETK